MALPTRLFVEESDGHVQVRWHPEGSLRPEAVGDSIPFETPLSKKDLEDLRWYLEDYLTTPFAVYKDRGETLGNQLRPWGEALFEAVFGSGKPGRDGYVKATQQDCELWISSKSPAFLSLPWELMQDPDRQTPLAFGLASVNRTIPETVESAELPSGESLRVLMVIARPSGDRDVGYRVIARRLLDRLEPVAGKVELEVLRPPTFDRLKERLEEAKAHGEPFQILHFDGHGVFREYPPGAAPDALRFQAEAPEGHLVFETEEGTEELVPAGTLAPVLKDAEVPLLVLNACQSATLGKQNENPEAAVATRFLHEGAASVVAMGYSVYVVAAAEFMSVFYDALFRGKSVPRAVAEGRRQLRRVNARPSPKGMLPLEDWLVPVHYARREVSFPQLQRQPRPEIQDLDLDHFLAAQREQETRKRAPREGVHVEGDLDAMDGVFFGRDREFQELEKVLRTKHVAVLHGVGGTGKTELAKGFARWLQRSGGLADPRMVFFHSFEPGVPSFGLAGVVGSIGGRIFDTRFFQLDEKQRTEAVLDLLRRYRILLIWDNFETVHSMPDPQGVTKTLDEAERAKIVEFLKVVRKKGKGGVIVTSRSSEDWLGGKVHRLAVRGLGRDDVLEYTEALLADQPAAQRARKDEAYAELLERLQGHPLSLRLMLPRLAETSAQELLGELQQGKALPEGFEGGEGRLESLGACIHYSFRHLPEAHRRRLPAVALFEGVGDINVLATLSSLNATPERFQGVSGASWVETLELSANLGLLARTELGPFSIHPALPGYLLALWREDAGDRFEAELSDARKASIRAQAGLGEWLNQQIESGAAETAMAMLHLEKRSLGAAAAEALDLGLYEEAQAILQPLDDYFDARGLFEEAREWVDRCRRVLEGPQEEPPDFDTAAGALWLFMVGSQANRAMNAGALAEAEKEHDAIRQALEGTEDETAQSRLGVAYHELGRVSEERGDLDSAESWYRKSLEITESLGNRPGMALTYGQLGRVFQERGDLGSAESWYQRAMTIFESLEDRPHLSAVYHELGRVSQALGDLGSAESWYRKSLSIKESLRDRPGMAGSYHQLGAVSQALGDLGSAESWYQRAVKIFESLEDRPHLSAVYHELGRVAQALGDLGSAESWYRKSLEITESLGNRPGMALTYGQLGLLAEESENSRQALEWTVRCNALFDEFPHPSTGPGPQHLTRLTAELGLPALEETWEQVTGNPLPEHVRSWVMERLKE